MVKPFSSFPTTNRLFTASSSCMYFKDESVSHLQFQCTVSEMKWSETTKNRMINERKRDCIRISLLNEQSNCLTIVQQRWSITFVWCLLHRCTLAENVMWHSVRYHTHFMEEVQWFYPLTEHSTNRNHQMVPNCSEMIY